MRRLAALVLALALAAPAVAGEAQDRLFAVGLLEAVPTGAHLVYSHSRGGSYDTARLPAIAEGEVEVVIAEGERGRTAELTLREGGETRSQLALPADGGSPVLLLFLETGVRSVAALTGGSPFYIRNRMREALARQDRREPAEVEIAGRTVAGERVAFRPFENDPNRERMGALADLELSVVVAAGIPGRFARLELAAGAGPDGEPLFSEAMAFERMEE
jgi:hypothetical protein